MMRARGAVPPGCTAASSIARTACAVSGETTGRPATGIAERESVIGTISQSRANTV